ncbi:YihY/virulence factor BrkB family protein [Citromicrobium bathyomarinum]|uniref:YihY/virulence factor BrkB family protein n=1 Tax=Citromicrobium bathyomarinum TaxID=72174 RepID=UPI00315A4528
MIKTLKRTWQGATQDNAGLVAAGVSYYAFLAMVPLLAVCVLLYGLVATPKAVARDIEALGRGLPSSAASLIGDQLRSVTEANDNTKGFGLLLALAVALFGARNAARAVIGGLNVVFNAEEDRGFLKSNAIALIVTLGAVFALAVAGTAISLAAALPGAAAPLASFGLMFLAGMLGAGFLYRFAPNRPDPPWSAVLPGAALFALVWVGATALFGSYVANFASYNATYGSLGAVIILLTWFYLSAYVLLLGGEFVQARFEADWRA